MGAGVEDNWYEAKKGDSMARIAKKFKLKISDLRRANPSLAATDVIQPGDQVNAVKPNKWVNVRFTEMVTREEALPYKTVEQTDDTLYTTQKNVKQEGKKGQREVVARITYINGMEAQEDVMSETVLTPALDRIVLKGTKKVPVNLDDNGNNDNGGKQTPKPGSNGGGTTSGSGFSLPLKEYRLTSTFRVRTLQGVTRWHYGDDLAAPTGTPIYAAKSGTVSYSGASSGYGLLMELDHGGGVRTRYGHCSKLLVKKGQQVKKGQIIALVGSTGHSTGPHCHFEIRINGKAVDPEKYVTVKH
jgi:murein DD-endopeptidase MepM/ murein hydrolase activator NlpD